MEKNKIVYLDSTKHGIFTIYFSYMKIRVLLESNSASASTVPLTGMGILDSDLLHRYAACGHIHVGKKLAHKAKIPYFVVKAV